MKVEMWLVERIKPYARNPRRINDAAIEAVASSIREFGWRVPIVVDEDGVILGGHTRLLAATQKLGMEQVPVHQALGLNEAQKRAYRIADNAVSEISNWDIPKLERCRGFDESSHRVFPLRKWTNAQVYGYLDLANIPHPPTLGRKEQGGLDFNPGALAALTAQDRERWDQEFPFSGVMQK